MKFIIMVFFTQFITCNTAFAQETKSKPLNPDIGINFLGLLATGGGISNESNASPRQGFSLQEAELQFASDVDPYSKAYITMAVSKEAGEEEFGIEPEEVYVVSSKISQVSLQAGKFKLALGKHNQLHKHAYPFINAPLIHEQILGDEGINEVGFGAAWLIPTSWYMELIGQAFSLSNEELFGASKASNTGGLLKLKNLWDLSDSTTMELGLAGLSGKNSREEIETTSVFAIDLTFKWRPVDGGKYQAFIWSNEYLFAQNRNENSDHLGGLASWIQYQFAQRWWIQARYEYVGKPKESDVASQDKRSLLIGFFPSEFSGLRLQYDHKTTEGEEGEHSVMLQYNFSIGAHPAHAY